MSKRYLCLPGAYGARGSRDDHSLHGLRGLGGKRPANHARSEAPVRLTHRDVRLSRANVGPLEVDSGRYTLAAAEKPFVIRNGQGIAIYITIATLTGKRGTLVIRSRAEFVGAGNGSTVGTGTWSLLRGTGAYDGATGGGRVAVVVATPRGFTSSQYEGFVRARAPS